MDENDRGLERTMKYYRDTYQAFCEPYDEMWSSPCQTLVVILQATNEASARRIACTYKPHFGDDIVCYSQTSNSQNPLKELTIADIGKLFELSMDPSECTLEFIPPVSRPSLLELIEERK